MSPMYFDRYARDGCHLQLIYEISRQNGVFSSNRDVIRFRKHIFQVESFLFYLTRIKPNFVFGWLFNLHERQINFDLIHSPD